MGDTIITWLSCTLLALLLRIEDILNWTEFGSDDLPPMGKFLEKIKNFGLMVF